MDVNINNYTKETNCICKNINKNVNTRLLHFNTVFLRNENY